MPVHIPEMSVWAEADGISAELESGCDEEAPIVYALDSKIPQRKTTEQLSIDQ